MNGPGRWLGTLARLAPGQARGRLAHELWRRAGAAAPRLLGRRYLDRPGASIAAAPLPAPALAALGPELEVARRWAAGEVEQLGAAGPAGWASPEQPRLWRYERQYHRELLALAALAAAAPDGPWPGQALAFAEGWARACPPVTPDAWEPYPAARRLLTWSTAALLDGGLRARLAPGLSAQRDFVERHLERHLGANHLLTEAAGLVAAGAVLAGPAAALGRALALLERALADQVLPDGGHLERTGRYHVAALHDACLALLLCRHAGHAAGPAPRATLGRLARWLEALRRADGSLPALNDAFLHGHPTADEALALARALGVTERPWGSWLAQAFGGEAVSAAAGSDAGDLWLPDTGWALLREGDHELLFDVGPLGPDEQPGHGHSDALGFELRWGGRPLVQDTGASTYQAGPVRDFERSARAHACVTVDGHGPDELWAAFRVGARGRVGGAPPVTTPGGLRLLRGWLEAPGGWRHERRLAWWPGRALVVHDVVEGAAGRRVEAHLPLAPEVALEGERLAVGGVALRLQVLSGRLRPGEGWVADGLDRRRPRASPVLEADAGRAAFAILAPGHTVELVGDWCSIAAPQRAERFPLTGAMAPR